MGAGEGDQLLGKQSVIAHTRAKMFQAKIIHFNTVLRVRLAKHSSIMQKYFSIKGTCIKRLFQYIWVLQIFLERQAMGSVGCGMPSQLQRELDAAPATLAPLA